MTTKRGNNACAYSAWRHGGEIVEAPPRGEGSGQRSNGGKAIQAPTGPARACLSLPGARSSGAACRRMSATKLFGEFQTWADTARELGFTDYLSAEDGFTSCFESGEKWRNAKSCGVYFWIAENGETYVGETLSARSRLLQHLKRHPDIRYASFQLAPPDERKGIEADLIERVNGLFPTRNIKGAVASEAHVPFDDFISVEDREAHLRGDWLEDDGEWREYPLLSQKHRQRFERLSVLPDAQTILGALFLYIWGVLPRPKVSERRFWSVSLFVGEHILRLNAGQQEMFTISRGEDGQLYARLLALEQFTCDAYGPLYQTRSFVHCLPIEDLPDWLDGAMLASSRELAIRLMRHTTTLHSASHCPQIVRAADEWAKAAEVRYGPVAL